MTTEEAMEIINDTFPEIKIKSVQLIGTGRNVNAVLVNDDVVFRIPIKENAKYNQPDKEVRVLNFLKGKLSFRIPQVLYWGTDKHGRRIIGETLVPGVVYTQEMHDSFDGVTKAKILGQIGKIMRELHDLGHDCSWSGKEPLKYTESLGAFDEYFPSTVQKLFTTAQKTKILAVRERYKELSEQFPVLPVLTHCDMHFSNMMFDANSQRIVGLIDFGEAGYAEPSRDMHYYYGDGIKQLMAGYGSVNDPYFMERQLFQSVTNMLCNIKEDLEYNKSPERNIQKLLSMV